MIHDVRDQIMLRGRWDSDGSTEGAEVELGATPDRYSLIAMPTIDSHESGDGEKPTVHPTLSANFLIRL